MYSVLLSWNNTAHLDETEPRRWNRNKKKNQRKKPRRMFRPNQAKWFRRVWCVMAKYRAFIVVESDLCWDLSGQICECVKEMCKRFQWTKGKRSNKALTTDRKPLLESCHDRVVRLCLDWCETKYLLHLTR